MNIGIATFHWADNYGAVLQAHALQTFLRDRGHSAQIIDLRPFAPVSLARKWLGKTPRAFLRKWERVMVARQFQSFRDRWLSMTPERFRSMEQLDLLAERFDVLITGSDQVWNPQWIARGQALVDFHFLAFGGRRPRRISYAASFGHAETDTLTPDDRRLLADGLRRLDAISVRESSGVPLVRELCGRGDAVQVCDPTLLLDPAHYHEMAGPRRPGGPFLFEFMLHARQRDADRIVRQAALDRSRRVLRCDVMKTRLHRGYSLPTPEAWLGCLRDADMVVTNSFHAVVFCLLFQTPFIAVLLDGTYGTMNARITELLRAARLDQRIVLPGAKLPDSLCREPIVWEGAEQALLDMKARGADYLEKQLAG